MYKFDRGGQAILPARQRTFFVKAINYSWWLHDQIKRKWGFFKGRYDKISSTSLLAEILYKSEFGDHPLSQEVYPPKTTKGANNLTLLLTDKAWTGKSLEYEGQRYKSFGSWEEFGVHFSDTLVFRKDEIDPYLYVTMDYNREKAELISNYRLKDFEIGAEEERRTEDW